MRNQQLEVEESFYNANMRRCAGNLSDVETYRRQAMKSERLPSLFMVECKVDKVQHI